VSATTIDDVLAGLDVVLDRSVTDGDRIGYFAAIYRTVTLKVHEGIEAGFFDDGERMEHLDIVFANRFLDAVAAHRRGQAVTQAWQLAFDAAQRWRPIVLQHLLVGINAHINLDLGIAAAEVAPGPRLPALRRDFERINEILASLVGNVRTNLVTVSPWIGLLDRQGGEGSDVLINFSITVARTDAWRFATELAPLPNAAWAGPIALRDTRVAQLGEIVLKPGRLSAGLLLVRLRERHGVAETIERLGHVPAPTLATVEARVSEAHPSR
jgi:hypothetical protein